MADHEEWNYSNGTKSNYPILKNYLEHTYRRIKTENKLAFTENNQFCCFHTGLVTPNYESIYAHFERNRNPITQTTTPYVFKAFLKESDIQLLEKFKTNLPKRANYFEKPAELIFDPTCTIIPNIDHIIEDNIERFPIHYRSADHKEIRRNLIGSIDEVTKKVQTNYKVAIPQVFNDKIQLFLPLCLTPNSPNADIALAVSKLDVNSYTARTILTLKMAYNNARLIVKPQSEWLKP